MPELVSPEESCTASSVLPIRQSRTLSAPRLWLLAGLFCFFCCMGTKVMADTLIDEAVGPPLQYRLAEVNIRLTKAFGHGRSPRRVNIVGTGKSTLEYDKKKSQFVYPDNDLLALLNELYKIRFFNLPTNSTTTYSVFLKNDGAVHTSVLRVQDTSSTTLCFSLKNYEKCVNFDGESLQNLENLAKRIFLQAEQLAQ